MDVEEFEVEDDIESIECAYAGTLYIDHVRSVTQGKQGPPWMSERKRV
jgi:hypothetical protein